MQKDGTIPLTEAQFKALKEAASSNPTLAAIYAYGAEPERIFPYYDPRPVMTAHGSVQFGKHCLVGMVWEACRAITLFEVPDITLGIAAVMDLRKDTNFIFGDEFVQAAGGTSKDDRYETLDCLLAKGQVLTEQSLRELPAALRATIPVNEPPVAPDAVYPRKPVVSAGVTWNCFHMGTAVIVSGPSSSNRIH